MDQNPTIECHTVLTPLDSFQPIKLLKISQAVLDKRWKFAEIIGEEALLEMSKSFAHYAAFQCNTDISNVLQPLPSSPKWIVQGIAASMLNRSKSYFPGSPFVDELLSVIKHVDSEMIEVSLENICQVRKSPLPDSVAIVMEGADVATVVDLALQLVFLPPRYKNCQDWTLSSILVQDSLFEELDKKLVTRCRRLVMSGRLNEADDLLIEMVEEAKKVGAEVKEICNGEGACCAAIIYSFKPKPFKLVKPVPILYVLPFRDALEGSKLANSMDHFCAVSVWGGDVSKNMEIADNLIDCSTVWLNSHGRTHPGVTVCSQPDCCILSARESRAVYRSVCESEVLIANLPPKFDPLNTLWKLLEVKEMEPYRGIILRWTSVDNLTVPVGLNIIGKMRGPMGKIVVKWDNGQESLYMNLIVAALACSNVVFVVVDDSAIKMESNIGKLLAAMLKVVPQGMLHVLEGSNHPLTANSIVVTSGGARNFVKPDSIVGDQDILWQLVRCQYIWVG